MSLVSSQGVSFGSLAGVKKLTIKKARASSATSSKLDASTLSIAHGGNRVYEDGLTDNGPNGATNGGITTTATVEFLGTGPNSGDTVTYGGVTLKCTEVERNNSAGELAGGTANYTSDYS
jgi:hypothetical protein